jgi:nucleoside-diphosphate-sugar epimerase
MSLDDTRVIPRFMIAARANKPLPVHGEGEQIRTFCYVDDLIAGIRKYAASELIEPVNLGNPGEFTVLELAEVVRGFFPEKNLQMEFLKIPKDDPKQRRPNIAKAKQLLGWEPRIILRDGLQKMRQELELLIVL